MAKTTIAEGSQAGSAEAQAGGVRAGVQLNDRQLVVLSAAVQRDDRAIEMPEALKGRAREAFGQALLRRGLAAEVMAVAGQPVWRQDETGSGVALVATAAALIALGIDEGAAADPAEALVPKHVGKPTRAAGRQQAGEARGDALDRTGLQRGGGCCRAGLASTHNAGCADRPAPEGPCDRADQGRGW